MTLKISPGLALPDDFATEGVAAIGMRGSGKSNTLVTWAERLYDAGIPFVAIDPKGDWWGIRSSADGKRAGLSVPVFGGLHSDFPLEERLGARIADLLVTNNVSAVLDVSRLSIGARMRFIAEFCNQLMERHQVEPHVRCVILEEAHRYIPQQVSTTTAKVKEAAAAILLEGRAFGLGCWAATQRPARLHKDVLEEVGTVVLHRIGAAATNDLRTIGGWVKHEDLGDEITSSLTKLGDGEAWVLAPSTLGIAKRVQVDRRRTFDSAATPLVGAGSRPSVTLADIDAGAIKEALADEIERAAADDPAALKRQIAALEAQVDKLEHRIIEPVEIPVEVHVPYVPAEIDGAADKLRQLLDDLDASLKEARRGRDSRSDISGARAAGDGAGAVAHGQPRDRGRVRLADSPDARAEVPVAPPHVPAQRLDPPRRRDDGGAAVPGSEGDVVLNRLAERKILSVLSQWRQGRTRSQLAILAGYAPGGGGFGNAERKLRRHGMVEKYGDSFIITAAGLDALAQHGGADPLPTGPALIEWWNKQLNRRAEREILRVLIDAWPGSLADDDVATLGINDKGEPYDASGGGFGNAMRKLRRLEIVDGEAHARRVCDELGGARA